MDAVAIDRAYDNAAAFPDVPVYRALWLSRSADVPAGPNAALDIPYGKHERQRLDIFPVGMSSAPTLLFFHGGFWSRNDKSTFRFLRHAIARAGMNAVFAGYRLAPQASLDDIAQDAAAATSYLRDNLSRFGLAARDLWLAGWSSGAHLVAQLMGQPGIAAGIAVSGLYDLLPMQLSGMNAILQLDSASAIRNSPILHPPLHAALLVVAYGANELPEFQRQSIDFHAAWRKVGLDVHLLALPGRHHHASLEEFYEPEGLLTRQLLAMRDELQ